MNEELFYGFTIEDWRRFGEHMGMTIPIVTQEECAELIQAISKMCRAKLRGKNLPRENLLEEIADVYIALILINYYWNISAEEITDWINRKMTRNLSRIDNR